MFSRFSYLFAFVLPINSCLFLLGGPHTSQAAIVWTLPFWLFLLLDWQAPDLPAQTDNKMSELYYDGILYGLACLQCINIVLMLDFAAKLPWQSLGDSGNSLVNLILVRFLVGASSGTSGIVVAHELIHRESRPQRLLGHLLLCSVCYDHFVIAHQRGHHDHLGMPDDIATARFGESFRAYWRRSYKGYFCYAWRSELERLGIDRNFWQAKLLRHRIVHGLAIELFLLVAILIMYGWLAVLMFLYQAFAAVRILEAVNYFQHWGLGEGKAGNTYGWVTTSWLSRYALIGLSNHIGHHQNAASRYHEIAFSERGPKMPYGYFVMNLWVKLHNASYRKMAEKELLNCDY
ncbi:fatty acid desaturase [Methylomicrobium sp. Wu6]|uniref:fatty acid desaturase n=1 Tax=Methylomicrobium sp. Wu6 TaxID=3107928 RepID=UPI002DD69590|nr:fatty acid desaturase [Methylomicrobium sp. Wu6]MEC4749191.1 fatty acid desaturase [Methylomicrobium sp. Wu6]